MEQAASSRLAIATVTHNSLAHLRRYFAGHVAAASAMSLPIVAVDNASRDGSAELLRKWEAKAGEHLTVVVNTRNRGYAAAANQAARTLAGHDVFLVNPDVELPGPDPLRALAEFLTGTARAGVVAPRLLNADGSTQASARSFPSVLAMAGHGSFAGRIPVARRASERYLRAPDARRPSRVDWLIGAAMLIRRRAFEDVGGFDERFFLYLEDTDFCLRCAEAGWETWYVPSVSLCHVHARASKPAQGSVYSSPARRRHIVSMVRFFWKHPRLIFGER